jgi:pyruvate ferredoxin oxidoreductase alpha subunit
MLPQSSNDILSARDTGFLQLYAETCQEVVDSILMEYCLAEDEAVGASTRLSRDGVSPLSH